MIKYVYGVALCAVIGSNAFGMQESDLRKLSVDQLEALEQQWQNDEKGFYRTHPDDSWKHSDVQMKEKEHLYGTICAIKEAIEDKVSASDRSGKISLASYRYFNHSQGHFVRESRPVEFLE